MIRSLGVLLKLGVNALQVNNGRLELPSAGDISCVFNIFNDKVKHCRTHGFRFGLQSLKRIGDKTSTFV